LLANVSISRVGLELVRRDTAHPTHSSTDTHADEDAKEAAVIPMSA
jgi:hypothetical protein